MKRILLVSSGGFEKGGVQNVLMSIVRCLHKEVKFDIILLTHDVGYYESEFESYGGKIFRVNRVISQNRIKNLISNFIFPIKLKLYIYHLCKETEYDAVHFNCGILSGPALRLCSKLNIGKRIIHIHGICEKIPFGLKQMPRYLYNKIYTKELLHYSTHKLACSYLAGNSIFKDNNFLFFPNPIESKFFSNKEILHEDNLNLIQVGYFTDNKNQLFTLEVLNELKKVLPNVKLTFIGFDIDGYLEKMKLYIDNNNLSDNVVILPENADVKKKMDMSSFLIFPSKNEGFGMVLIEAQCRGIYCFSSDTVPQETNCGGVDYLSLENGAQLWANKILKRFEIEGNKRGEYDCEMYSYSSFKKNIMDIYG